MKMKQLIKSIRVRSRPSYHNYVPDYLYNSPKEFNYNSFYIKYFFSKVLSRPNVGLLHNHDLLGAPSPYKLHVPEKGVPRRGEQYPAEKYFYKGYSPPKSTCNDTPHIQVKTCTFLLKCLHVMDENVTRLIP